MCPRGKKGFILWPRGSIVHGCPLSLATMGLLGAVAPPGSAPWHLLAKVNTTPPSNIQTHTTERRPTRGLTRTQKRTVCHPGADWCQRLGVVNPGLSRHSGSCCIGACSSDGGFGRRITLHYLRRPNHRVILNEKFALDSWTVSDTMHWGQIGSALVCLQGGAFKGTALTF